MVSWAISNLAIIQPVIQYIITNPQIFNETHKYKSEKAFINKTSILFRKFDDIVTQ